MKSQVQFILNGSPITVSGKAVLKTLAEFLRERCLTGTKIVCDEGDCGACAVLIGTPDSDEGRVRYEALDSCIRFVFQMHGTHVVTIEALGRPGNLSTVQQTMVDNHASQCGYCTPGFAVSLTAHCEANDGGVDPSTLRNDLRGHLCRCTGYLQILKSALALGKGTVRPLADKFPDESILPMLVEQGSEALTVTESGALVVLSPVTLGEAAEMRKTHPEAIVVAGATDIGVLRNKKKLPKKPLLDIRRIDELRFTKLEHGMIKLGALATWTDVSAFCRHEVPKFAEILDRFGGLEIMNAATVGGNVINASPTADSIPFFMVCDAELELLSADGIRSVPICDFYRGYKMLDLREDELLTEVTFVPPTSEQELFLSRVSRRHDLDIAGFTGAVLMHLDGDTITDVRIAMGAVGPTVVRLKATEEFLLGRALTDETIAEASEIVLTEITPRSDVRGSADYRNTLAKSFLPHFFAERQSAVWA